MVSPIGTRVPMLAPLLPLGLKTTVRSIGRPAFDEDGRGLPPGREFGEPVSNPCPLAAGRDRPLLPVLRVLVLGFLGELGELLLQVVLDGGHSIVGFLNDHGLQIVAWFREQVLQVSRDVLAKCVAPSSELTC